MNERTWRRKLRNQRYWCAFAGVGIGLFLTLSLLEFLPPPAPQSRTLRMTARSDIKAENVTGVDAPSHRLPDMSPSPGVVAAPEPSSLMLLTPALLLLVRRRRRQ